jgi:hypothetical protein
MQIWVYVMVYVILVDSELLVSGLAVATLSKADGSVFSWAIKAG